MSKAFLLVIILTVVLTRPYLGYGEAKCIGLSFAPDSSTGLPDGWEVLTFPRVSRLTTYTVDGKAAKFWVKEESNASASALIKDLQLDPKAYPILCWRWKVQNIVRKGDELKKEGDDYSARVYVNFGYDPKKASLLERA